MISTTAIILVCLWYYAGTCARAKWVTAGFTILVWLIALVFSAVVWVLNPS